MPPSTDPVPPSTNQHHSILTWYHQVSTISNLYCCCLGITDSCTVYPGSCLPNDQLFWHHFLRFWRVVLQKSGLLCTKVKKRGHFPQRNRSNRCRRNAKDATKLLRYLSKNITSRACMYFGGFCSKHMYFGWSWSKYTLVGFGADILWVILKQIHIGWFWRNTLVKAKVRIFDERRIWSPNFTELENLMRPFSDFMGGQGRQILKVWEPRLETRLEVTLWCFACLN